MIDIEDVVRKRLALYRAYDIRADNRRRSGRGKEGKLTCVRSLNEEINSETNSSGIPPQVGQGGTSSLGMISSRNVLSI